MTGGASVSRASGLVLLLGFSVDLLLAIAYRGFVLPNNPVLVLLLLAGGLLRLRYDHWALSLALSGALALLAVVIPGGIASRLIIHGNLREYGIWAFPVHIGVNAGILGAFVALEVVSPRKRSDR